MSLNFKTQNKNYNSSKYSKKHKANSSPSFAAWTTTAVALGTLGLLAFVASPDISNDASAAPLNLSATVDLVLSLAIQDLSSSPIDTVSAEINNSASGMTNTAKVIASTNNANGYTLTLADNDNITDLAPYNSTTGTYDTSGPTIAPISGDMSLSSFSPNTWGYAVVYSNTNTSTPTPPTTFSPMSTTPVELYTEVEGPGTGYHYFTAAAKVGDLLPGNTYEDKVTFSLTATPAPTPPPAFFAITNMQDMDATICNSVDTPASSVTNVTANDGSDYVPGGTIVPSHTLTDTRDNQQYTVRKLADGNCWMTENLRLGKNGTVALNDQNSNMSSGRTFNVPAATTTVGTSWGNQDEYPFVFYRDSNPGAVNPTVKPTGVTPDGPSSLYNWYTATAGARDASGNSLMTATSGQAADSVCPKGWQLPINGSGYTASKSYMNLIYVYTGATGNSGAQAGTEQGTINENRIKTMLGTPLSFIYPDLYNYGGALYSRPLSAYWSSSVYSAAGSYLLVFFTFDTNRELDPQEYNDKGFAFAVRCVVAQ